MMKRSFYAIALAGLVASFAFLDSRAVGQTAAAPASDPNRALLNTYCIGCHNARTKIGNLALDTLDLTNAADNAQTWEKAVRKLRGRLMPPPGSPQPAQKDVDAFVAFMENNLDTHAKGPTAGHVPIQRLNRTEYAAAVKALVGVDVQEKEVLPQDIEVEGFDNVAAALNVSPAFLDQYVTAARHIAELAVGNPNPRVADTKYLISANRNPDVPMPPGTRGGVKFKHNFPADGEYRITINDLGAGLYTATLENETTLVMMIDGKLVFRQNVGGPEDQALVDQKGADGRAQMMERFTKIPVKVQAGVRDIVVAFIDRPHVSSDDNVGGGFDGFGGNNTRIPTLVDGIQVAGPYNPTGVSMTPSRALIFVCDPKEIGEPTCARQIATNLARRAYRRPVTDKDVARLMPFYENARTKGGSFDLGVQNVVTAVLASPDFLYRSIRSPQTGEVALTDLELASRLSFFLWNAGPDEQLLTRAIAGNLTKPGALEVEVQRMLADPKASSLVTSFAMKWLNLDDLDSVKPDPNIFRGFNDEMRRDFTREVEQFISSIFLDGRSVVDLIGANHTFLNERLAKHYGIAGVTGPQFRRVTLDNAARFGLTGKAAVLMKTSYPDRTSPVLRGAWVLDKLMATPPPPPPPNVATNLSQVAGEAPKTVRARLELHRSAAACKMCHGVIDPTGLALENFDSIGQFRTRDPEANAPIDASTVLPSGKPIDGPVQLREFLLSRPDMFAQAVTERLMMYAINRPLEYFDMPQVRAVVRGAAKDNYTLSSLILGIVNTNAFRKQGPESAAK